jgi:hypothetical protein
VGRYKKYQAAYNRAGMKDQQWYIAAANAGDPYTIILYDPVSQEKATTISNGVYLKENSRKRVYTHDGATGHAWLWVQHKNGTWYWIDPTWTDNTGYVWWGIVQNGKEVQYYPDPEYCVAADYPRPGAITPSPASTYIEYPSASKPETPRPASTYTDAPLVNALAAHLLSPLSGKHVAVILCFNTPFISLDSWSSGLSLSVERTKIIKSYIPFSLSLDYISTRNANSIILGTAFGYPALERVVMYAGGGLGFNMYDETYDMWGYQTYDDESIIAWKLNGGVNVILLNWLAIKFDVSFGTIIGPTLGIGVGGVF